MSLKGRKQKFSILRGEGENTALEEYDLELDEGMVQNQNPWERLRTLNFLKSVPRRAETPFVHRSKMPPDKCRRA